MGIEDKVDHLKIKPKVEEFEIRDLDEEASLTARDFLWNAGHVLKPVLSSEVGFVGTFFYAIGNDYVYKTVTSVEFVPEKVAQMGCMELSKGVMRSYGHKVPNA